MERSRYLADEERTWERANSPLVTPELKLTNSFGHDCVSQLFWLSVTRVI
jgi:hypothetical protein